MANLDLIEIIQRPAVLTPAVLIVAYLVYRLFFKPSDLPDLPILNAKQGEWFPLWRASWRNALDFKAACKQAHSQYYDQACIVPLVGSGNMIMLPAKHTKFVIDQPESVLSLHDSAMESLQCDYTMEGQLVHQPVHHHIITTTLTQQIGNLVPDLAEETELSLDHLWGTDTAGWRDVCVYKSLQQSIGRVTNRIFIGTPVCRDPDLVRLGIAFAQDVPLTSSVLRLVPSVLRPLVAPLVTLPNRLHERAFLKMVVPTVERRLREYDARRKGDIKEEKEIGLDPEPNDLLQWMIKQAKESGDPYLCSPRTLALRVLILNFASIHTSSFAITGVILDLVSSKREYIDELREEIRTVLGQHGGVWNKRALAQMEKLDSAFRESQRLNSFVTIGLGRMVKPKEGLMTPDGVHMPMGIRVCVPGYAVHHDSDIYPDAEEFQPFRFSEKRRVNVGETGEDGGADQASSYVSRARQQWATTTNDFLGFGHGRAACPGRFFAATELKLMLAHLILHYDFEMLESRPRNKWFAVNRVPPMEQNIRIRRRQD
ncbi:Ent-kaurene oxidase [Cytospora mali]|uniref:Ent-kaurene oxidase n=1 Tax=Cytospora mali TaxID=578113 RepID=A0A194W581_CYTMA|nr:Ent-kaurene oxidase [Valsa mali]